MNTIINDNSSLIQSIESQLSTKLLKISNSCISTNIQNAENTINSSYQYLSIIYEYLEKIKEQLDGFSKGSVDYLILISLIDVIGVYVKEIDYTVSQSIYDKKYLIVPSTYSEKTIKFPFGISYNFTDNPIGLPISSAKNKPYFVYDCPIIDSSTLKLDFFFNPLQIQKVICSVTNTQIPPINKLVNINGSIGLFVKSNSEDEWEFDIFYNYVNLINDSSIIDFDTNILYGTILSINCNSLITPLSDYPNLITIIHYLQNITDTALKTVWNYIDVMNIYLYICNINTKLNDTHQYIINY